MLTDLAEHWIDPRKEELRGPASAVWSAGVIRQGVHTSSRSGFRPVVQQEWYKYAVVVFILRRRSCLYCNIGCRMANIRQLNASCRRRWHSELPTTREVVKARRRRDGATVGPQCLSCSRGGGVRVRGEEAKEACLQPDVFLAADWWNNPQSRRRPKHKNKTNEARAGSPRIRVAGPPGSVRCRHH